MCKENYLYYIITILLYIVFVVGSQKFDPRSHNFFTQRRLYQIECDR